MKSRLYCCFLILTFSGIPYFAKGQNISNKLNFHTGFALGKFHGNPSFNEGNFTFPALFPNLRTLNGYSLKALYRTHDYFSLGLGLENMRSSGWSLSGEEIYIGSKVNLVSTTALLQVHTKFAETGTYNKMKIYLEVAPTIGSANLALANPMFTARNEDSIQPPESITNQFYGIGGRLGLEYSISQTVGVYGNFSNAFHWISSSFYVDKNFTVSQLGIGMYVKLLKDKRYFY